MASGILVRGMVCERCISVIKEGVKNLRYEITKISLGKLCLKTEPGAEDLRKIENFLETNGFEMISKRQVKITNQVKELIDHVFRHNAGHGSTPKFTALLSEKLHMNYDSIGALFRNLEGITLEKYIINKRLEKVKELLVYSNLTMTEIASTTGFNSISHLSRQFKQLTGLPPSHFKSLRSAKQMAAGESADEDPA